VDVKRKAKLVSARYILLKLSRSSYRDRQVANPGIRRQMG
jgi:hypothetical protein